MMATEHSATRSRMVKDIRSLAVHETPAFCQASSVITAICARHTIQFAAVRKEPKDLRKPGHRVAAGLINPYSALAKTLRLHAKAQSMHHASSGRDMACDGLVVLLQASRRTAQLSSLLTRWGLPAWAQILRSPAWTPKESAGRCDPHGYTKERQEHAWLAP